MVPAPSGHDYSNNGYRSNVRRRPRSPSPLRHRHRRSPTPDRRHRGGSPGVGRQHIRGPPFLRNRRSPSGGRRARSSDSLSPMHMMRAPPPPPMPPRSPSFGRRTDLRRRSPPPPPPPRRCSRSPLARPCAFRHLPSRDLSESDFSLGSKKYSNRNRYDGWRIRMAKIHEDAWKQFDQGSRGHLIDTHCHLDFLFIKVSFFSHIDEYFRAFHEAFFPCFDSIITVFCNPASLRPSQFRIWSRILDHRRIYATCGVHPHASASWNEDVKRDLIESLAHPKVKAVGECGIDRSHKNQIPVEIQAKCLKSQLKLAVRFKKPVVFHAREAYSETLRVARKILPKDHRIHLHCYTADWETAREWISCFSNVMFGFTPLLTFANDNRVAKTIENLPLNRILLETDSPYFVPRELFQDTNLAHPGFVYSVAETIARIKEASLGEVVRQTEINARAFYDLD